MNKTLKKINTISYFILAFLLIGGLLWVYVYVLEPSIISTKTSCFIINETELSDLGYTTVGAFFYNDSDSSDYILIDNRILNTPEFSRTLKHERIHYIQKKSERLDGCELTFGFPFGRLFNEIEAKFMENFNSRFLNTFYRTDVF